MSTEKMEELKLLSSDESEQSNNNKQSCPKDKNTSA